MKVMLIIAVTVIAAGCDSVTITSGESITASELEEFFRKHQIDGNPAVALKKRSAVASYLATVHGYPNNLSVCEQLIAPYNNDSSLSTVPGEYFCEELR